MSLTRNAPPMLSTLAFLAMFAFGLIACGHNHPQPQIFRREGWKGYMGLPPKGFDYGGRVELRGDARDSLAVEVTVRNPTTDSVVVQISTMCRGVGPAFSVRVYGPPHGRLRRRGHPVWTLDGWREAKERETRAKRPRVSAMINGIGFDYVLETHVGEIELRPDQRQRR